MGRDQVKTTDTHKINAGLLSLSRPVKSLKEDPKNARTHRELDLATLAKSLNKFGQQKPIVALADGTVIAGNGTLAAVRDVLKWTHIAVVTFDDADEAKARAFALADNRTAELSSWDFDALSASLRELPNELMIDVGFSAKELAAFLVDPTTIDVAGSEGHTREFTIGSIKVGGVTCPKCGFEFDPETEEEKE